MVLAFVYNLRKSSVKVSIEYYHNADVKIYLGVGEPQSCY